MTDITTHGAADADTDDEDVSAGRTGDATDDGIAIDEGNRTIPQDRIVPDGGTEVGTDDGRRAATDGGVADAGPGADAGGDIDYLEAEINLLKPSTPFMRDHLKQVWAGFLAWVVLTWGPVTATYLAPGLMTQPIPIIDFPAHYFSVAFLAPTSSLVLAFIYSRRRDRLDEKYGIDHSTAEVDAGGDADAETAAADGGEVQ
ncbi:DUF4212 domain-containing protein [Halobellus sp. EA9]|uniref:DUF4212 domain-containing protein n=1 Tax=Halobellus sp. EA9 TaxID=3421647 RepID=UPI003EBCACFA